MISFTLKCYKCGAYVGWQMRWIAQMSLCKTGILPHIERGNRDINRWGTHDLPSRAYVSCPGLYKNMEHFITMSKISLCEISVSCWLHINRHWCFSSSIDLRKAQIVLYSALIQKGMRSSSSKLAQGYQSSEEVLHLSEKGIKFRRSPGHGRMIWLD